MPLRSRHSIRSQLMWLTLVIVSVSTALFLLGALTLTLGSERASLNRNLLNSAAILTRVPMVSGALRGQVSQTELAAFLDSATVNVSDIDLILVGDLNSTLIYAPDPSDVGTRYTGTIQASVLAGGGAITSDDSGPMGLDHAACAPVYGEDGTLLGFVVVGVYLRSMAQVTQLTVIRYLVIGLMAAGLGALLALRLSRNIKDTLMGYEPAAFAQRFHQREDILEALEEGVLAIDTAQNVIFFNRAAADMLSLKETDLGRPLHAIYSKSTLDRILRTKRPEYNVSIRSLTRAQVISDRLPLYEDGRIAGVVGIFRNRTEVARLTDDLNGVRHMVDAMRAYTHEFMNKLHVILGLLQIGEPEKAQQYIMDTTRIQQEAVSRIMNQIGEPAVAALLVGKTSRANELGIRLKLDRESVLRADNAWLPPDAYITILGNLIENAIEGLNRSPRGAKEISVSIREDDHSLLLCVEDNGPGIPVDMRSRLFQRGVSSKGSSRGTGLSLVREVVDAYRGEIRVESESGVGTAFFISFRR